MMGAAGALAGLVIVAASVNIAEVVKAPSLASRLAGGIAGLVLALSGAAVGLVPQVSPMSYGSAMAVLAVGAGLLQVQATRRIYENHHPDNQMKFGKSAVGFVAPFAYLVGAALLIAGSPQGVVWFAAGSSVAIITALVISWIALVEVLR
ncbi:hypothetical protein OOK31_39310 [Streptomyces sp. NBC_00249]|uniref:hypothetical protein n=1 Tax=Streptomyces sp. NBC_00249 TaxID=2975690 RepID=UPI00225C118F|nr:hypothetical protein [Streptomyces sp. NBC_00249]MCX5199853.1 hypothetical protein [Streptomyces sp. NBC_00249]